jgi:hypothetical protein
MKIYCLTDLFLSTIQVFNTGRPYGPEGQILAICQTTDGKVVMMDFTRDLQYVYYIPPTYSAPTMAEVLEAYDNNRHLISAGITWQIEFVLKQAAGLA